MAFSGISSYIITIDNFLAHWLSVNSSPTGAVLLAGGYARADLQADRAEMQLILSKQEDLDNSLQIVQFQRDQRRAALLERFSQLRAAIEVYVKDSPYAGNLPDKPGRNAGSAVLLKALDDAASTWEKINGATIPGFSGPLTLRGGYGLADFVADLAVMRNTYPELAQATNDAALNRRQREELYQKVRGQLIDYRKVVELNFSAGTPLFETLPLLTPPSGATPDRPQVSGEWDASVGKARIVVAPLNDPKVTRLQLRTSEDVPYQTASERTVKTQPASETTFLTDDGLSVPGSEEQFRMYAMTDAGHEAGSLTITIQRPE